MAEAIGLGASILGIAAFGATVVTTLRKFGGSYTTADEKMAVLSANVSLTASILTELGNTIKEYEKDLHLTAHNFVRVKAACERDFQRLHSALRRAKKGEDGIEVTTSATGKKRITEKLSPWEKLKFSLGGEDELKELITSLETAKSNLQLLLDSVNLVILKKLNQKHLLDEEQSADLKDLVRHIPILVKVLQGAEFIPWSSKPTTIMDNATYPGHFQNSASVEAPPIGTSSQIDNINVLPVYLPFNETIPPITAPSPVPDARKSPEILQQNPDIMKGTLDAANIPFADHAKVAAQKSESMKPFLASPPPVAVASLAPGILNPEKTTSDDPVSGDPTSGNANLSKPARWLGNSWEKMKFRLPERTHITDVSKEENAEKVQPPSTRTSTCNSDSESMYEGWLLEKNEDFSRQPGSVLSLLGFKILKVYSTHDHEMYYSSDDSRDHEDRLFTITPYSNDQTKLKEQLQIFTGKNTKNDNQFRIQRIVKSFEKYAQSEIKRLIKARNRSSPKGYEWLVVALVPLVELRSRWLLSSTRSDRGLKHQTQILIVLRGGNAMKRKPLQQPPDSKTLPTRYGNAWQRSKNGDAVQHDEHDMSTAQEIAKDRTVETVLTRSVMHRTREISPTRVRDDSPSNIEVRRLRERVHRSGNYRSEKVAFHRNADNGSVAVSQRSWTSSNSYDDLNNSFRGRRSRDDIDSLRTDSSVVHSDLRDGRDEPAWTRATREIPEQQASREATATLELMRSEKGDKEYKKRLVDDLQKSGMDEKQIALVLEKDKKNQHNDHRRAEFEMARKNKSKATTKELNATIEATSLRYEEEKQLAKQRLELRSELDKARRELQMARKEGNMEVKMRAEARYGKLVQKWQELDITPVIPQEAELHDSRTETKERAKMEEERANDRRERLRTYRDETAEERQTRLRNSSIIARQEEELDEARKEELRRRRAGRRALYNSEINSRPTGPLRPRSRSSSITTSAETISSFPESSVQREDDELLPQEEAERLMDDFLATFTAIDENAVTDI